MDPQALLALQLLTKTITDLPLAIQRVMSAGASEGRVSAFDRPQPVIVMGPKPLPVSGAGSGGGETGSRAITTEERRPASALSQLLTTLTSKFAAVLGPLAILNAVVGSTISGFQTMGTAVKLLGTVLAPVLLPATVLIATALTALADVILKTLEPGMESFFGVMLSLGLPILISFIDMLQFATETLGAWAEELGIGPNGRSDREMAADLVEQTINAFSPVIGTLGRTAAEELAGSGALGDGPSKSASSTVMNALRDVMGSLRLSIGPKAQIGNIEGIGKSVQLAALNQDPLEKRMYDAQVKFFGMMERAVDRFANERAPYTPGGGDFSGQTGGYAPTDGGDF